MAKLGARGQRRAWGSAASLLTATLTLSALSGTASAFCGGHGVCNKPPRVAVKIGKASAETGRVMIRVTASDAHFKKLRIILPESTPKGSIARATRRDGAASGSFTYTPNAAARHAAASDQATPADTTDSFTVTVTDGYGGTTEVPVSVPISPQNSPPVAGTPSVGSPDPTTGVVTGQVNADDADGDPLTYEVVTPPTKGTVAVDADGAFTYTPTAAAPQSRGATDPQTDTFTITITDGYGGAIDVPVNLPSGAYGSLAVTAPQAVRR